MKLYSMFHRAKKKPWRLQSKFRNFSNILKWKFNNEHRITEMFLPSYANYLDEMDCGKRN